MNYCFPINGEWTSFSDKDLKALESQGDKDEAEYFRFLFEEYKKNPLASFSPHGIPWSPKARPMASGRFVIPARNYDKKMKNDGAAFLSDTVGDGCLMLGPNQCGKTSLLSVWTALRVLECDPEWPIFTCSNVKHIPWEGPKRWVVASYSWDNVATLWDRIREFFPVNELGAYAPSGRKNLSFGDGRPKRLVLESSKSELVFLCYTQQQHHWEGFRSHGASFDEQNEREKFIGWKRSTITAGDDVQFCMALTGHVLDGRPDTGQAGWIYKDLFLQENTMGMLIHNYHLSVESTPDEIISKKKKKALHEQWVAKKNKEGKVIVRSQKDERAALARYWGWWEMGSGSVFGGDVWQRDVHVIDPIWEDAHVPQDVTKYRVIDYGSARGVNCCGWFALTREGLAYLYRLLYVRGMEIAEFVPAVISASHNTRSLIGEQRDDRTGNTYQYYEETQIGERYWYNALDSRSCAQSQQGATLESIFSRYGLMVTPGSGQRDAIQIPRLKDWLRIDPNKTNPHTGTMGCPRLFFFDRPEIQDAVREVEGARLPPDGQSSYIHKRDPQHFIDVAKMWASLEPVYMGDAGIRGDEDDGSEKYDGDEYTGY